jgi:hypothetical protein
LGRQPISDRHVDALEAALARTEAAAGRALEASADVAKALRRLRTSAQVGNLRDLRATPATVEQAADRARDEAHGAASSWQLDEDAYFSSGRFSEELLSAAESVPRLLFCTADEVGVELFSQDVRVDVPVGRDELADLDIVATGRDVLEAYLTREAPVLD